MTPEQLREHLIRRFAATYDADERAIAEATAKLPETVRRIVEVLGERRIVLFGSHRRGLFREASDIDLAVEGVGIEAPRALLDELVRIAGRRVDLVDPEVVGSRCSGRSLAGGCSMSPSDKADRLLIELRDAVLDDVSTARAQVQP